MVYIENTGHIKNHKNSVILFWSQESEKPIFTIFPEFLQAKIGNTEIASETTIPEISSETTIPEISSETTPSGSTGGSGGTGG